MKSFRKIVGIAPAIGAALYALPLLAEESGQKTGLPQLDTTFFPEQLFWLAVTFGALYLLMAFVALPGVRRTQDKRQAIIEAELAAAKAANEAAKQMMAQYEKTLAEAKAKAQATVGAISAQIAKESSDKQAHRQQELQKRLHDAEMKIHAARNAALGEIKGAASDLAQSIVESVAGLKVKA